MSHPFLPTWSDPVSLQGSLLARYTVGRQRDVIGDRDLLSGAASHQAAMAAAFAVHIASLFARHRDSLSFAVPILLSADMIYNYYHVTQLWRERCAEWEAEEQSSLCSAMSGVCQRVVSACSKLEDQTWAQAMQRLQPQAVIPGSLQPRQQEAHQADEAADFLAFMGLVSRRGSKLRADMSSIRLQLGLTMYLDLCREAAVPCHLPLQAPLAAPPATASSDVPLLARPWAICSNAAASCAAAVSGSTAISYIRQCSDQAAAGLQTSLRQVPLELTACQRVSALRWHVAWRSVSHRELPMDERMLSAVDCILSD